MLLSCDKLSFSYTSWQGEALFAILKDITFNLEDKENILILAEPESGKTTLSLILSSLIPAYFDGVLEGDLKLDGKGLPSAAELLGSIALVPQNSAEYTITSSVEDEIIYPLESLSLTKGEMSIRLERELSRWGLDKLRHVGTGELSGGEKRRLMLGAAYASNPSVIIYDESFDDLDLCWRSFLAEDIKARNHASIVFASHYLPVFDNLFDKTYVLENGILAEKESSAFKRPEGVVFSRRKGRRESVLTAENILFTHPHRNTADSDAFVLKADDFHIATGEIVTLTGANGSGKSTFSRLLCGLDVPESGSFFLNAAKADGKLLTRSVGYMFQNPDYQIFLPSVRDELSFSLDYLTLSAEEKEAKLLDLAALFDLDLEQVASLMSYGARKRLQAAIYYNLDRPFYILDELDSALNYRESYKIVDCLASRGAGILLITHDPDFALDIKDRGYCFKDGVLYEE